MKDSNCSPHHKFGRPDRRPMTADRRKTISVQILAVGGLLSAVIRLI